MLSGLRFYNLWSEPLVLARGQQDPSSDPFLCVPPAISGFNDEVIRDWLLAITAAKMTMWKGLGSGAALCEGLRVDQLHNWQGGGILRCEEKLFKGAKRHSLENTSNKTYNAINFVTQSTTHYLICQNRSE